MRSNLNSAIRVARPLQWNTRHTGRLRCSSKLLDGLVRSRKLTFRRSRVNLSNSARSSALTMAVWPRPSCTQDIYDFLSSVPFKTTKRLFWYRPNKVSETKGLCYSYRRRDPYRWVPFKLCVLNQRQNFCANFSFRRYVLT